MARKSKPRKDYDPYISVDPCAQEKALQVLSRGEEGEMVEVLWRLGHNLHAYTYIDEHDDEGNILDEKYFGVFVADTDNCDCFDLFEVKGHDSHVYDEIQRIAFDLSLLMPVKCELTSEILVCKSYESYIEGKYLWMT